MLPRCEVHISSMLACSNYQLANNRKKKKKKKRERERERERENNILTFSGPSKHKYSGPNLMKACLEIKINYKHKGGKDHES